MFFKRGTTFAASYRLAGCCVVNENNLLKSHCIVTISVGLVYCSVFFFTFSLYYGDESISYCTDYSRIYIDRTDDEHLDMKFLRQKQKKENIP
jgi:hypothetical protein